MNEINEHDLSIVRSYSISQVLHVKTSREVRYDDPEVRTFKLNAERQNGRAAMLGITGCLIHELLGVDALYPTGGLGGAAPPPIIAALAVQGRAGNVQMFSEGDIGVLPPLGVYDPLGLIETRDMRRSERRAARMRGANCEWEGNRVRSSFIELFTSTEYHELAMILSYTLNITFYASTFSVALVPVLPQLSKLA